MGKPLKNPTGKSLVLSVSAGTGCYRHIQIDERETLLTLSSTILDSFEFFDDHMHSFFMNNIAWDEDAEFVCPGTELDGARGYTNNVKLSDFRLGKGDKFLYIFDFGDDWRFRIKVLREVDGPTQSPIELRSKGRISQYGEEEEDDEQDNEDDE